MLDLLIRGGRVVDGAGNPWYQADVAVAGGRIVAVGSGLRHEPARRVLDTAGLIVCPGFVDMHTHSDIQLLANPPHEAKLMQGVTLEVLGQDGLSLGPHHRQDAAAVLHSPLMAPGTAIRPMLTGPGGRSAPSSWTASTGRVAPNVADTWSRTAPCGWAVMGQQGDGAPTEAQLEAMRAHIDQGMR